MNQTSSSTGWRGYRWRICALLFFATTINYMDRSILGLLKPMLDHQLHWTDYQYGLVNAFFQGAYGIGLLFFGWLVDRFGTKTGYAVSIVAWSLAAIGHAFAFSVRGFTAARVGLGLSEGGNFPSAIKAVAEWFPKSERALATSIFNAGSNVAQFAAPAIIPWIAITYSWHAAFVFTGILGFIWLLLWLFTYRTPEKHPSVTPEELSYIEADKQSPDAEHGEKIPWAHLFKYREAWAFIVGKFLTDPVWWFFLIWLPDYFHKQRGLDMKSLGTPLIVIYGTVTVLSIFGGWLPDALVKRGWSVNRARKTSMFIYALCVVPILFATHCSFWGAVALIALAASAHQAWSANIFTTVSDMFPKKAVGSVVGIGGMAGSLGGIFFPPLAGWVLDHYLHAGYGILFAFCAFAYLLAFGIMHILAPRFEPVKWRDSK